MPAELIKPYKEAYVATSKLGKQAAILLTLGIQGYCYLLL